MLLSLLRCCTPALVAADSATLAGWVAPALLVCLVQCMLSTAASSSAATAPLTLLQLLLLCLHILLFLLLLWFVVTESTCCREAEHCLLAKATAPLTGAARPALLLFASCLPCPLLLLLQGRTGSPLLTAPPRQLLLTLLLGSPLHPLSRGAEAGRGLSPIWCAAAVLRQPVLLWASMHKALVLLPLLLALVLLVLLLNVCSTLPPWPTFCIAACC
jgi:hypothetical protein